jgi:hypothetical protein
MEARIVREELQKCQKAEGVNHYAVCKPLVETYLELLKDAKVSGIAREQAARSQPVTSSKRGTRLRLSSQSHEMEKLLVLRRFQAVAVRQRRQARLLIPHRHVSLNLISLLHHRSRATRLSTKCRLPGPVLQYN